MTGIEPALVATRFVHFAATMGIFGTTLWALYAQPPARRAVPVIAVLARAVVALASGALWAGLTLSHIVGNGVTQAGAFETMMVETGFGRAFLAQALLATILIIALAARPRLRWAHLVVSAGLLGGLAFIGHSAAGRGPYGGARLAGQAIHLIAAGAWLGALPALWASLRTLDPPTAALAVRRFSTVGMAAVSAILITGAINTALMLGMSSAFASSLYFRVLLVKLTLVLGMIALAVVNWRSVTPHIQAAPARALRALRRNVLIEQSLGLGVLAAVSLLGTLDPSM